MFDTKRHLPSVPWHQVYLQVAAFLHRLPPHTSTHLAHVINFTCVSDRREFRDSHTSCNLARALSNRNTEPPRHLATRRSCDQLCNLIGSRLHLMQCVFFLFCFFVFRGGGGGGVIHTLIVYTDDEVRVLLIIMASHFNRSSGYFTHFWSLLLQTASVLFLTWFTGPDGAVAMS